MQTPTEHSPAEYSLTAPQQGTGGAVEPDVWDAFLTAVEAEIPRAQELRWSLHENPRVSGDETETLHAVIEALEVDTWQEVAETGALIRIGSATGAAIGIRAELDALPIVEETGAQRAATNGAMHACGHDVHIAAAVAVARAAQRVQLPIALLLILQPREEAYPSGARDICESRLLEPHQLQCVLGAHVHPRVKAGAIAIGEGAVNAAADEFRIVVKGVGGHAAYPHHARDPIVALAAVVGALQTMVSRRINPMHPAVVTFGSLSAGSAANVIPEVAIARGSMRTMNSEDRRFLHDTVPQLVASVVAAYGCEAEVEIVRGEPVLYNDHRAAGAIRRALEIRDIDTAAPLRSCGADDFSYYSERFPGVMMFVGTGTHADGPALHSAKFLPREEAVRDIAIAYAVGMRAVSEAG